MSNESTSFDETMTGPSVTEKVSDAAAQVKEKVSDLGRTAADKINENRGAAASGLEKAASAVHEKAANLPGGEKVAEVAHSTADKLTSTAEYVRDHDVNSMMADVERLVKNSPGPALLIAGVIGFLVGRAFTSND
jgi:ElaB/YqjD/DUF883 family membrane-anchored ribosome-binding protein